MRAAGPEIRDGADLRHANGTTLQTPRRRRLVRLPLSRRRRRACGGQAARSFGNFARLQAAMVIVNCPRTLSRPRWTVWAIPPAVLAQPKGSSIFFLHRWYLA